MSTVINLLQVLRLDERAYWELRDRKKNIAGGAIVVGTLGLVYGFTNWMLFRELLAMMSSQISMITGAIAIILGGFFIAFLVHAGMVLLTWSISKGFKGSGNFSLLYGNLGLAMAPLIFVAPLVSYIWFAEINPSAYFLTAPFLAWFWVVMVQAIKTAEGHSYRRATAVMLTCTVFSLSLLYLWLPW